MKLGNEETLQRIKGGLIVSCQALPEEPLHSSFIMGRMALAASQAGAVGIRANTVADIKEIRNMVDLPIIGIIKKVYDDCPDVYITPTIAEVDALTACGVEIIATDATRRDRQAVRHRDLLFQSQGQVPGSALYGGLLQRGGGYGGRRAGLRPHWHHHGQLYPLHQGLPAASL